MFTAKAFLRNSDYDTLPDHLRADPERLSLEFFEIATDRRAPHLYRLKSLRILRTHGDALAFGNYPGLSLGLITAFEREFPAAALDEIAEAQRAGRCHYNSVLLYGFCLTLAKLAGESGRGCVDAACQVFKWTDRGPQLEACVEMIRRQREGLEP
jgi:hypothetical protein